MQFVSSFKVSFSRGIAATDLRCDKNWYTGFFYKFNSVYNGEKTYAHQLTISPDFRVRFFFEKPCTQQEGDRQWAECDSGLKPWQRLRNLTWANRTALVPMWSLQLASSERLFDWRLDGQTCLSCRCDEFVDVDDTFPSAPVNHTRQ